MTSAHRSFGPVILVSSTTDGTEEGPCDVISEDNNTYVCCNDTMMLRGIGKNAACCGQAVYKYDTHMCCDGKIYEDVADLECCGKERFSVKYQVCPSDKIITDGDLMLCGNDYYHSGYRMCCGQITYPIYHHARCCGERMHDIRTSMCIDGEIVDLLTECCGGSAMNSQFELCCDGGSGEYFPIVKNKPDDDRCCRTDGKTYTSATHDCGPNGVERRRLLISHCGTQEYNPIRDICCEGFVYRGGKSRGLHCQDIISHPTQTSIEEIFFLNCPDQCPISTITEIHQVYKCSFHAFIAKRIQKSKHTLGGHRRFLVTSDLMAAVDNRKRIFKFSQNCKSCIPKPKRIIVIVKDLISPVKTFFIFKNTKITRKHLRKMCN
ncbi:galaxin-like [Ylistrum balloti]|uniref:galaxin-like n=1 Tax=Ylistrum balloti TaxID=509963 RepID=UPI002905CACF|nr:galaxin-like [Ylistrum balloti]